jgi:hypothetical protein
MFIKGGGLDEATKANAIAFGNRDQTVQPASIGVDLVKTNGQWQLDKITCPAPHGP